MSLVYATVTIISRDISLQQYLYDVCNLCSTRNYCNLAMESYC